MHAKLSLSEFRRNVCTSQQSTNYSLENDPFYNRLEQCMILGAAEGKLQKNIARKVSCYLST